MNQSNLKPTILKYGLTAGLIFSLTYLISTVTGLASSGSQAFSILSGLITFGLMIALIIVAIKNHRDQLQGGFISLGQCVLIGAGMLALAGLLTGLVTLVYTNIIDPGFSDRIIATMEEAWETQGLNEEQIEAAKSMMSFTKNPYLLFASTLACYAIGGAILSLIIGLIMKREAPEFS